MFFGFLKGLFVLEAMGLTGKPVRFSWGHATNVEECHSSDPRNHSKLGANMRVVAAMSGGTIRP